MVGLDLANGGQHRPGKPGAGVSRGSIEGKIVRGISCWAVGLAALPPMMPTDAIITRPRRNVMKRPIPTSSFVIAAAAWSARASETASTKQGSGACPYRSAYDAAS